MIQLIQSSETLGALHSDLLFSALTYSFSLEGMLHLAISTGRTFSSYLEKEMMPQNTPAVQFFMYFDEAHVLAKPKANTTHPLKQTKFHILGRVLGKMNELPFFVVFLSTNSWLGAFAPSTHMIPSARDWTGITLHAPFTELPFDTFAENAFSDLAKAKGRVPRLDDVCTLDFIVKFGRPL